MGGLTDFKDQACDKYTDQTNRAKNQLKRLHQKTRGPLNEVKNKLNNLKSKATTPIDELTDKLKKLNKDMMDKVPDLSNNDDLNALKKLCGKLNDLLDGSGSLDDAIKDVTDATQNLITNVLNDSADSLMKNVEEYAAGQAMNVLDELFGEAKIPNILGTLDPLLQCLNDMCPGSSTNEIVDELNTMQNEMGFTDDGNFDSGLIMDQVGMSNDKKTNLTSIDSVITQTKSDASTSVSKQVENLFNSEKKAKKNSVIGKISGYF